MRWKPIRKLTDADLEKGWMHNRLATANAMLRAAGAK